MSVVTEYLMLRAKDTNELSLEVERAIGQNAWKLQGGPVFDGKLWYQAITRQKPVLQSPQIDSKRV